MARKRPSTIAEYIEAAPEAGRSHLSRLHMLLREEAPGAQEALKWGTPFFVEPRFLYAFSAHKAHLSLAPIPAVFEAFRDELKAHRTTKNTLQIPYDLEFPEDLLRRIARFSVEQLARREGDSFW